MKKVVFASLILGLLCQSAVAGDLDKFGSQMSRFYLSPSAEAFKTFQRRAEQFRPQLERAGNGADILVAVMVARISAKYGWPIQAGYFGELAREILKGQSALAKYVADDTRVNPTKLDIWWASFFATGDGKYLNNIFQYAGLELRKGDTAALLVISAAKWSFKSNCRQHKKIRQFAEHKLNGGNLSQSQLALLRECTHGTEQDATPDGPKS